jgi:Uma2 family endonuclease
MVADVLVAPWAEPMPPPYSGRYFTAAALAALPDDGWLHELVMGRLVRMPPPKSRHGYLEARLGTALYTYVGQQELGCVYVGETGFDLTLPGEAVETVLGADIAFVRAERVPSDEPVDEDETYFRGAPDLAVEVASPSQYRPEMSAKAWQWLHRGSRLVWAVWPTRREVDVWTPGQQAPLTLHSADVLDGREVVPGFTYAPADLFA